MATINELASQYFERLKQAKYGRYEILKIASEINQLVYDGTQQRISIADKRKIIEAIRDHEQVILEHRQVFASDNEDFLEALKLLEEETK